MDDPAVTEKDRGIPNQPFSEFRRGLEEQARRLGGDLEGGERVKVSAQVNQARELIDKAEGVVGGLIDDAVRKSVAEGGGDPMKVAENLRHWATHPGLPDLVRAQAAEAAKYDVTQADLKVLVDNNFDMEGYVRHYLKAESVAAVGGAAVERVTGEREIKVKQVMEEAARPAEREEERQAEEVRGGTGTEEFVSGLREEPGVADRRMAVAQPRQERTDVVGSTGAVSPGEKPERLSLRESMEDAAVLRGDGGKPAVRERVGARGGPGYIKQPERESSGGKKGWELGDVVEGEFREEVGEDTTSTGEGEAPEIKIGGDGGGRASEPGVGAMGGGVNWDEVAAVLGLSMTGDQLRRWLDENRGKEDPYNLRGKVNDAVKAAREERRAARASTAAAPGGDGGDKGDGGKDSGPAAAEDEKAEEEKGPSRWEQIEEELTKTAELEIKHWVISPKAAERAEELREERDGIWKGEYKSGFGSEKTVAGSIIRGEVSSDENAEAMRAMGQSVDRPDPLETVVDAVERKVEGLETEIATGGATGKDRQDVAVTRSWWQGVARNVRREVLKREKKWYTQNAKYGVEWDEGKEEELVTLEAECKYLNWGKNKKPTKEMWGALAERHLRWLEAETTDGATVKAAKAAEQVQNAAAAAAAARGPAAPAGFEQMGSAKYKGLDLEDQRFLETAAPDRVEVWIGEKVAFLESPGTADGGQKAIEGLMLWVGEHKRTRPELAAMAEKALIRLKLWEVDGVMAKLENDWTPGAFAAFDSAGKEAFDGEKGTELLNKAWVELAPLVVRIEENIDFIKVYLAAVDPDEMNDTYKALAEHWGVAVTDVRAAFRLWHVTGRKTKWDAEMPDVRGDLVVNLKKDAQKPKVDTFKQLYVAAEKEKDEKKRESKDKQVTTFLEAEAARLGATTDEMGAAYLKVYSEERSEVVLEIPHCRQAGREAVAYVLNTPYFMKKKLQVDAAEALDLYNIYDRGDLVSCLDNARLTAAGWRKNEKGWVDDLGAGNPARWKFRLGDFGTYTDALAKEKATQDAMKEFQLEKRTYVKLGAVYGQQRHIKDSALKLYVLKKLAVAATRSEVERVAKGEASDKILRGKEEKVNYRAEISAALEKAIASVRASEKQAAFDAELKRIAMLTCTGDLIAWARKRAEAEVRSGLTWKEKLAPAGEAAKSMIASPLKKK